MLLTKTRLAAAALLVASAAAFAAGAAIEHHTAASEQHMAVSEHHTARHAEAGTGGEHSASAEPARSGERPSRHAAEHTTSETLLGINPEATWLVVTAVALSLLLAALTLTVGSPLLAAAVALIMLAFTALDLRELAHQLSESRPGLAALAAAVAVLHLLAGAAAIRATRDSRTSPAAGLS
jgi:hypothetical protein